MREILFRGKRKDNGEWVYGYYEFYNGGHYINIQIDRVNSGGYPIREFIEIDPSTVGQYTGLTANGTKIFEDDIVKCTDTFSDYELFIAVVMFGNPKGEYNWGFQLNRISGANANTDILLWVDVEETGAFIEIIGNIHDNPELLKGGAE